MKEDLTKEFLNKLFYYENGKLYWKISRNGHKKIGKEAGSISKRYKIIRIYGVGDLIKTYNVHRIIWIMHNGKIKDGYEIDHIDQNPLNNNLNNLRSVSKSVNGMNKVMLSNNKSGYNGVNFYKERNKFKASIKVNQKQKFLGYFENIQDAVNARKEAEKIFGFHENHGNQYKVDQTRQ